MQETTFRYAGFWKRLAAYIIDFLILIVPFVLVGYVIATAMMAGAQTEEELNAALADFEAASNGIGLLIGWVYWAAMESSPKQATFGKMALGIKVTDLEGVRISFGKASGRYFGKILSALLFFVGFIIIGFTKKKQGLHDMMAGTLVVNKG